MTAVAMLLLLVPVFVYFSFIHEYGVNAILYDQWENVALITHGTFYFHSYVGHTSLGMLWAQHNENRMLFPNLIVLALGSLTHLNVLTEMYISAVMLVIALFLIILTHRHDLESRHLMFYVPLAFLLLTLGQSGDTLFGFQMAWFLVLLALAATLFLLNTFRVGWLVLLAAMATAIIASYSSLQGLLVWPAGLVVLLWKHPKQTVVMIATWLAAAIATTAIYFNNYDFSTTSGGRSYLMSHPLAVAKFFFFLIGDVMGKGLPSTPSASDPDVLATGVVIFLLSVVCLAVYARPGHLSKSPIGPALICFGILFAVTVAYGRSSGGLAVASQSRYATFSLLVLAGCYLCLLEGWPLRGGAPSRLALREIPLNFVDHPEQTFRAEWKRFVLLGLRFLALLVIVIEVWGGFQNGNSVGPASRQLQQTAALVAAHARIVPNSLIKSALFPNQYPPYDDIRGLAERAKADRLSFFATGEGARLAAERLPRVDFQPPQTRLVRPMDGAVLRGPAYLVATATGDFPITSVVFEVSGVGGQPSEQFHAERFQYGFLGAWPTTDVPNGSYVIKSIVRDSYGQMRTSQPLSVTVDN